MKYAVIIVVLGLITTSKAFGAEAGMPQLNPEYWVSQSFWLIITFSILYIIISKFFIPKIKNNLDERENKIKKDLEEAKNLKVLAEKKLVEYENIILKGKKEVNRILIESKEKLDRDINNKKKVIEKDINNEILKAEKEILDLKKSSKESIKNISESITTKIIEEISGDKLNESSIKAAVEETTKKNLDRYL